jgi:hypothetical protein
MFTVPLPSNRSHIVACTCVAGMRLPNCCLAMGLHVAVYLIGGPFFSVDNIHCFLSFVCVFFFRLMVLKDVRVFVFLNSLMMIPVSFLVYEYVKVAHFFCVCFFGCVFCSLLFGLRFL